MDWNEQMTAPYFTFVSSIQFVFGVIAVVVVVAFMSLTHSPMHWWFIYVVLSG